MNQTTTIQFYDLAARYRAGRLSDLSGRDAEYARLYRLLLRPEQHHVVITGDPGCGKTSFIESLSYRLQQSPVINLPQRVLVLNCDPLVDLLIDGGAITHCANALQQAAQQLTDGIIIIDDLHLLFGDDPTRFEAIQRLISPFLQHPAIRLIVTTTTEHYEKLFRSNYVLNRSFERLALHTFSPEEAEAIIAAKKPSNQPTLDATVIQQAVTLGHRYHLGRALPDSALRLIDEAIAKVTLENRSVVSSEDIVAIVAERENIPIGALTQDETDHLLQLEDDLNRKIIGQQEAIYAIVGTIQRARMGFHDATRPRGSFLLLGPSGVGKTETAKALAEAVYQNEQAFVRLDMSEFSEAHSSVRLIGSPPGYVGYEEGGQLTNPIAKEPYSLVLLDEIEKAHPKLFDLFLQVLDDGRLTDSSGKTVDFTQTIIIATSNCASQLITDAYRQGENIQAPEFYQTKLLPVLTSHFRPEFINRFDSVLVYKPLSVNDLVTLAYRELGRLEERLKKHDITFSLPDDYLAELLRDSYNPLFGARPVRRIIQTKIEAPLVSYLLSTHNRAPLTITGRELWLSTH